MHYSNAGLVNRRTFLYAPPTFQLLVAGSTCQRVLNPFPLPPLLLPLFYYSPPSPSPEVLQHGFELFAVIFLHLEKQGTQCDTEPTIASSQTTSKISLAAAATTAVPRGFLSKD